MNTNLNSVKDGFNKGNMFSDLFWPYKYISEVKPTNNKDELMYKIQMYTFTSLEMNLYLDLYPDDIQIIGLYNQYKDELDRLTYEYENKYGKICLGINDNYTWDWVKSPWPWERG